MAVEQSPRIDALAAIDVQLAVGDHAIGYSVDVPAGASPMTAARKDEAGWDGEQQVSALLDERHASRGDVVVSVVVDLDELVDARLDASSRTARTELRDDEISGPWCKRRRGRTR